MVAYTFRMPAGIPGDINRIAAATVEAAVITSFGTTGHPTAYGVPVVIDATSGRVRTMVAADTVPYGLLARPYPTTSSQDGLGTSTPPNDGACDVMVRGYMTVLLSGATAATKAAPVNIWTAVSTTAHTQGGFEVTVASGSTVAVSRTYFMGPADSSSNVEVAFNI